MILCSRTFRRRLPWRTNFTALHVTSSPRRGIVRVVAPEGLGVREGKTEVLRQDLAPRPHVRLRELHHREQRAQVVIELLAAAKEVW
jgi:hypothetical protein